MTYTFYLGLHVHLQSFKAPCPERSEQTDLLSWFLIVDRLSEILSFCSIITKTFTDRHLPLGDVGFILCCLHLQEK